MEMNQVRYFLSLCEEGGFVRAARRCGVAQPSLTTAIKRLEFELGGRLFQRTNRGAALTPLGEKLKPHFHDIQESVNALYSYSGYEGRWQYLPAAKQPARQLLQSPES